MWGEHEGMGWWMLLGSVWFVFFWGLVIWAFVQLFGGRERGADREAGATPLEIARRRYASGEISREKFEEIKRDLGA